MTCDICVWSYSGLACGNKGTVIFAIMLGLLFPVEFFVVLVLAVILLLPVKPVTVPVVVDIVGP